MLLARWRPLGIGINVFNHYIFVGVRNMLDTKCLMGTIIPPLNEYLYTSVTLIRHNMIECSHGQHGI